MNSHGLLFLSVVCTGILLALTYAVLTVAPNWLFPGYDDTLYGAVLSYRPFIAFLLPDRSFIEDMVSIPLLCSNSVNCTMISGTMIAFHQQESR
jgi:hypothetical protein